MKNTLMMLAITMAAFAFPIQSRAKIGETLKECIARYGEVVQKEVNVAGFEKDGFMIVVSFHEGKVERIVYAKAKKNFRGISAPITDAEMEVLMKANAPVWKKPDFKKPYWETPHTGPNGESYATYDLDTHLLMVATREFLNRKAAREKAKLLERARGF